MGEVGKKGKNIQEESRFLNKNPCFFVIVCRPNTVAEDRTL